MSTSFRRSRSDHRLDYHQYVWIIVAALVAVGFVFWQHLTAQGTFIGNSDRLNTYLSMRLTEYDSIGLQGKPAAWSPFMFGGFSTAALHWMNFGRDPLSFALHLFPREELFRVLGFIPPLLLISAAITAFLYIRPLCSWPAAGIVGAIAYALSVFSVHRVAQVDNAHLTIVLIPLGLFFIHRMRAGRLLSSYIGLTIVVAAMTYLGFLQEVAYTLIFFGCYALYRGARVMRASRAEAFTSLALYAAACMTALLFAAPRLVSVAQEVALLHRGGQFNLVGFHQILRFFHEGLYGRTFAEAQQLGNNINVHEGLQLTSSTMLALMVFFLLYKSASTIARPVAFLVCALLLLSLGLLVPPEIPLLRTSSPFHAAIIGAVLLICVVFLAVRGGRAGGKQTRFQSTDDDDATFHLMAVAVLLFLIVTRQGTTLIYLLFAKGDFLHGRMSVLLILPLCVLFAQILSKMREGVPNYDRLGDAAVLAIGAAAGYAVHGPFLDYFISLGSIRLPTQQGSYLQPIVAAQVVATLAIFAVAVSITYLRREVKTHLLAAFLAGFVLSESAAYARFKIEGSPTWSYPIPFRDHNYMNVAPFALRPPSEKALTAFRDALETDHWRTVEINGFKEFPVMTTAHISAFWQIRSLGGYSTSPSSRLASLPWPPHLQSGRSLHFAAAEEFDQNTLALMAALNVKYLLIVTPQLYFNVRAAPENASLTERSLVKFGPNTRSIAANAIDVQVKENPVHPLPRHFFVRRISQAPSGLGHPPRTSESDDALRQMFREPRSLMDRSFAEGVAELDDLDVTGEIQVDYRFDSINVRMQRSEKHRFLVINDLYHPAWNAISGDEALPILPTNIVMRGILIPPGMDRIDLRFLPFSSRAAAFLIQAGAAILFLCVLLAIRFWLRSAMRSNQADLKA